MSTPTLKLARGLELPLDVVTEATGIVATRGAGKSSTAAVLVEETTAAGVPVVVIDWTGVFWGLRSNAKGDGPGLSVYVLGGQHGDVPLEVSAGRFIADLVVDSGHSFVLDLSDFTKGSMRRFCADFLERLYDRKARARTTLLLVIDEAHELAPQSPRGGFKGDAARLIGAMEQVVALGRSRGIGAVVITQRTQALNKAVLDLIETLIIMRMLSPRAVAAVKDWIVVKNEDDEHGVLASLPELPTGTAWFWSPLRGILERATIRRIQTFDSYATPKPGEARVEPKARRELDMDVLGEQMRATVERAKADDPRELRKRIAELEKALANIPEPEIERVEVPVISPEIVQAIDDYNTELQEALRSIATQLSDVASSGPELIAMVRGSGVKLQRVDDTQRPSPAGRSGPIARRPQPRPTGPPSARGASVPPAASNGQGDITPARQRILNAMANLASIGVMQPTKLQVALFAGASPKSSAYQNNVSGLRTSGYLDYPVPNLCMLTSDGEKAAVWPESAITDTELHANIQRLITPARWRIVEALIELYPDMTTKEDLAERVGASAASSAYQNNVSGLRSLGLIGYPERGWVVALPVLFTEQT